MTNMFHYFYDSFKSGLLEAYADSLSHFEKIGVRVVKKFTDEAMMIVSKFKSLVNFSVISSTESVFLELKSKLFVFFDEAIRYFLDRLKKAVIILARGGNSGIDYKAIFEELIAAKNKSPTLNFRHV